MRAAWETNRDVTRRYKRGRYWCWGCDLRLVSDWKKCSICGTRSGRKRGRRQGLHS